MFTPRFAGVFLELWLPEPWLRLVLRDESFGKAPRIAKRIRKTFFILIPLAVNYLHGSHNSPCGKFARKFSESVPILWRIGRSQACIKIHALANLG